MSADSKTTITAKQLDRLTELKSKIQLTEKQAIERDTLEEKKNAKPAFQFNTRRQRDSHKESRGV
jgi:hypothetical protein